MNKKNSAGKILKVVFNVIGWVFVAFAVAVTILVFAAQNDDGVPMIAGKCVINILSGSMEPTFNAGDVVIGSALTYEEKCSLQAKDDEKGIEGDIITFYSDLDGNGTKEINTHRVVGVNHDESGKVISYVTKGDNAVTNIVEDKDPVACDLVICKYSGTKIAGVGKFLGFLQTSTGFLLVIVLPLAAIFIYELVKFLLTVKEVRGAGKKTITSDEEERIKQAAIEEYLREQAAKNASGDNSGENRRDGE